MSYLFELDPNEEAASSLISDVGSQLQKAVLCERARKKLTLQSIAESMNIDRSQVHRMLSGHSNLTLRSLAAFVNALNYRISVAIEPIDSDLNCNFFETREMKTILGRSIPSHSVSRLEYEFEDA